MRLIDADALLERFNRKADICTALMDKDTAGDFAFYCKLADAIEEMQTIEAEPVRHGRWREKMLDNFRKYEVVCSECEARYIGNYDAYDEPYDFNYCPNCGAKMDGGEE